MRTMRVVIWVWVGLLTASPGAAWGQTYAPELGVTGPFVWNLGGSVVWPLDDSADRSHTAGGLTVGVTFNPNPVAGLQFEYGANWSNLKTGRLSSAGIGGNGFLQYFDLNLMVRPGRSGRGSFYLIGGGGLYYRVADITKVEGTALAPYCDPYFYYCSVVPVTATSLIGSRNSWDWGLDAGLGVTFGVRPPVGVYLEVRYHYIFGPSYTDFEGAERNADGQYLPVTLGVRF
jgi:hypothetical protein